MEELKAMEEGRETTEEEKNLEGELRTALEPRAETLPSTEFVKVEKNLASLGFFTPSSKRTRNEKSKSVSVTVVVDGKRYEAKATIAPTALFGLPITADQDKWLALHKILSDIQLRDGELRNPVSFSSAELLALLKIYKDSGKNYHAVSEWLDVMVGTTIISEGAVYLSGKRTFGKDTFHVFDRAVSFGKQLPDGSIADRNYVWLSQWQLENINNHHQLPIELDTYRQLKNYIAKALVPLLQVWLFATRDEGVFEKRYDELCEILHIRKWNYVSKIREKLGPSLDELKEFGYLADWRIGETSDGESYKILFYHGEKFHRDRRARLSRKQSTNGVERHREQAGRSPSADNGQHQGHGTQSHPTAPASSHAFADPRLIAEFTRRGIREQKAYELVANLKPGQDVIAQLEHADLTIKQLENTPHRVTNPAGFYVRLIEWNTPVPDGFETSAKRKAREEKERRERAERAAEDAHHELEDAYQNYCYEAVDRYIEENPAAYETLREAKAQEERERNHSAWPELVATAAKVAAKYEIRKQLQLMTFEEFAALREQGTDFSLKPVAPSPAGDPGPLVEPMGELVVAGGEYADTPPEAPAIIEETQAAANLPTDQPMAPGVPEAGDSGAQLSVTTETVTTAPGYAGIGEPQTIPAAEIAAPATDEGTAESQATPQEEALPEATAPAIELMSEPPRSEAGEIPNEEPNLI